MKRQRIFWLVFLTAAFLVCIFSRWLPFHAVAPTRVVIERDSNDSVRTGPSQAKTGYDPYVDRVNVVSPDLSIAGTSNTANPGR